MGTFRVPLEVGDPQGERFEQVEALMDTGAAYTTLPASLLRRLGVEPHTRRTFQFANGERQEFPMGRTWVRVNGALEITLVVFGEEGVPPLLGAYTLEGLGLAPDPVNRRLVSVALFPLMAAWRAR